VARATVSPQEETHLRNAQEELREEHVEIATYKRIEAFAIEVGDKETAQLAKSIRRDEERMAKFLDAELLRLVKDVVRAEIPRDQRTTPRRRTTRGTTTSRSTPTRSRTKSRTATGVVRSTGRSSSGRSSARSSSGTRGGAGSRNGASATKRSASRARASSRA
jgi:hypothetical protein